MNSKSAMITQMNVFKIHSLERLLSSMKRCCLLDISRAYTCLFWLWRRVWISSPKCWSMNIHAVFVIVLVSTMKTELCNELCNLDRQFIE